MKICPKCGTRQKNRAFCIDCGESLGKRLTKEQEEALQRDAERTMDTMNRETDPFHVNLGDKIAGWAALAALVAVLICNIIFFSHIQYCLQNIFLAPFFAACALLAFRPEWIWELNRLELSIWIHKGSQAEPSYWWGKKRRVILWASVIFGIVFFLITLPGLINPPALRAEDPSVLPKIIYD